MEPKASPYIRILRWDGVHESAQTRKVRGALTWVALPTRQGRGYCRLVATHGAAGLGVWCALLEVAGNQKIDARGTIRGTVEDAALVARLDPAEVLSVIPTLVAIGWVEVVQDRPQTAELGGDTTTLPAAYQRPTTVAALQDRTGQDMTLQDRTGDGAGPKPPAPAPTQRDRVAKALKRLTCKGVQKCREAIRSAEARGKDLDWIEARLSDNQPLMGEWPDAWLARVMKQGGEAGGLSIYEQGGGIDWGKRVQQRLEQERRNLRG